jgi:hypothetical protein
MRKPSLTRESVGRSLSVWTCETDTTFRVYSTISARTRTRLIKVKWPESDEVDTGFPRLIVSARQVMRIHVAYLAAEVNSADQAHSLGAEEQPPGDELASGWIERFRAEARSVDIWKW